MCKRQTTTNGISADKARTNDGTGWDTCNVVLPVHMLYIAVMRGNNKQSAASCSKNSQCNERKVCTQQALACQRIPHREVSDITSHMHIVPLYKEVIHRRC